MPVFPDLSKDTSRNLRVLCGPLKAGLPKLGGHINLENARVSISWTLTVYEIGDIIFAELKCQVIFNTL